MYLSIVGAVLVIVASGGLGWYFAMQLKERIAQLEALKKKILILRGDIRYANTTLPDAVEGIAAREEEKKGFFCGLSEDLRLGEGQSFFELWKKRVAVSYKDSALTEKDKQNLTRLGEYLGQMDKEMQLGQLDLYLEHADRAIAEARTSEKEKSRLYQMLGILGGIFLCIVMI